MIDNKALLAALRDAADPECTAPMKAYMKNRFEFLGVTKPHIGQICKPFFKQSASQEIDWPFVRECWKNPYRELQYCALNYLKAVQKQLTPQDIPRLEKLITEKSWWDTSDVLDRIVGGIALNYSEVNAVLLDWSRSDNIWLRRVAIDHQLLRKEKTDTELLEQIICNNLAQKEFFINKAIGWALRDYSKTNPAWVRAFIARHRSLMAALSIREAEKYL
ncbi:DNA alkylation repair protein [Neisseria shayeganii]|uniref:DNA alkylation repair protein n=1 Tax=Neisseria shayeganii TaxID=607712 RepID=UPI001FD433F5|nr:DNA alkylation repair protein [Neisseria shayeganii]